MDIATLIGFIGAWAILFMGMGLNNLQAFFDLNSIYIVIGGTSGAVLMAYPLNRVLTAWSVARNAIFVKSKSPIETIKLLIEFAEQARREGILALESRSNDIKDDFLRKGIQLAVDGTEPELIKDILSTEITFVESRHKASTSIFEFTATMAPSFGMLGTVIGLILMLGNMSDVESLGPNMAVALITTLYGSMIANVICTPIANKLKIYSGQEVLVKELMLEGIMALQSGDNPRIIEQKLVAFIEPKIRVAAMKEEKKK